VAATTAVFWVNTLRGIKTQIPNAPPSVFWWKLADLGPASKRRNPTANGEPGTACLTALRMREKPCSASYSIWLNKCSRLRCVGSPHNFHDWRSSTDRFMAERCGRVTRKSGRWGPAATVRFSQLSDPSSLTP